MLISFEGIDGSGKTSVMNAVADQLEQQGFTVMTLQEPGTTAMGLELRKILKSDIPRSLLTEVLMFMAARSELVEKLIKPNLTEYDFILLDRYVDSTVAYQGYGNGNPVHIIDELNHISTQDIYPDATFYIHVNMATAKVRRLLRNDEKDKLDTDSEFAKRVYDGYQDIANERRVFTIENKDFDETVKSIVALLTEPI